MAKKFRTILHGTCLLKGKHPPGSKLAKECPVLRLQECKNVLETGGSLSPYVPPSESLEKDQQKQDIAGIVSRTPRGGRPRIHETDQDRWREAKRRKRQSWPMEPRDDE